MAEPLRIMSLHALAYCELLFYLEEVEETRLADERVYAGRRLHVEIEKTEDLRTRKGGVLSKPDIPRRKKKSTTNTTPPPWETKVESPKQEETEHPNATQAESGSSFEDGEPLRLTLESEKW